MALAIIDGYPWPAVSVHYSSEPGCRTTLRDRQVLHVLPYTAFAQGGRCGCAQIVVAGQGRLWASWPIPEEGR